MSSGAYDYAYSKIYDLANQIIQNTPQRKAFVELLRKVANAAHDIEWVDSADYAKCDENKAIEACFVSLPGEVLRICLEMAETAKDDLERAIAMARKGN